MLSIELSLFTHRLAAICEEMGASLQRSAFSPNIKDRLDYSCALFSASGELCAQAAHIPVHLGSMAFAMTDIVSTQHWQAGDVVIVNDPFLGGTHLPDVTVIAPVFRAERLMGFVANRAHHANIGAEAPGSMPIASSLEQEGAVIAPTLLVRGGQWNTAVFDRLTGSEDDAQTKGDFYAQVSACELGVKRAGALIETTGAEVFEQLLTQLNDYSESLALNEWKRIPNGEYRFEDRMDGDGLGGVDIPIGLSLRIAEGRITADFTGTAGQVTGNINCPLSVTAAAVYYVFRCLLPAYAPACAGTFRPIELIAPEGTLVNARRPAAVAAGNVETSSRLVDVVLGALGKAMPDAIPAASQGTMNNLAMGSRKTAQYPAWNYYETLGGGAGAGPLGNGLAGRQTHMTNTLNTPVESIEQHFPLRITRYQLRRGSGGQGDYTGGDGVIREFEFLAPAEATLLTERRRHQPWGANGACAGQAGCNRLDNQKIDGKASVKLNAGDRLTMETPGGGGWNWPAQTR